jgi:hypothetical protein
LFRPARLPLIHQFGGYRSIVAGERPQVRLLALCRRGAQPITNHLSKIDVENVAD